MTQRFTLSLQWIRVILFIIILFIAQAVCAQAPVLGTYPNTTVVAGRNTTVTPSAVPTNTTSTVAYGPTDFNGVLAVNPATGVVTVTDAMHAGVFTITVKAFGTGTITTNFTLTVTNPTCSQGLFRTSPNVAVGAAHSVVVGDFNNDGIQDIAIANGSGASVSVRIGNGTGGFTGTTNLATGSTTRYLAIGDLNNDGNQDIVNSNVSAASLSVHLGNGLGGFTAASNVPVAAFPTGVSIGDFNNDGNKDLVAGTSGTAVSIVLGDGTGSFSGATTLTVSTGAAWTNAIGDFNEDGNQDLAIANNTTVAIRLGNGAGGFTGTTNVAVGTGADGVVVGDFNNDANQDFAVTNGSTGSVSVRLGDGLGNFSGSTELATGTTPIGLAAGDFNGDGNTDLAVGRFSGNVVVRYGDGLGGFTGTTSFFTTNNGIRRLAVGDFNNDGYQDMVVPSEAGSFVGIFLGNAGEIDITGNSNTIADGDVTPSITDNTHFGSNCGATTITKTFNIQNTGLTQLAISGITFTGPGAADFTLVGVPPTSISPSGSVSIQVTFTPSAAGLRNATLTIANDDCNEALYDFAISGFSSTALVASFGSQTNVTIYGGNTGAASINTPTGGTSPYTYDWTPGNPAGDGTTSVTALTAGTYTCTVTDAGGCTATQTFSITQPGAALNFDGNNDNVQVASPTGIPIGNSAYTLEAWIKPSSFGNRGIIGWGNYGAGNEVNALRLDGSGMVVNYWWGNDLAVSPTNTFGGSPSINLLDGNWHHIAATFDGTTRKIYVDGYLKGQDTPVGHNVTSTADFRIGSTCPSCGGQYFHGDIDEVRVWNRGLCQGEIQNNMNCEIPTTGTGLVANYHFNQGSASANNAGVNTLTDASGSGNHGTLLGFALNGLSSNWKGPGGVAGGTSCSAFTAPVVTLNTNGQTNVSCFGGSNGAASVTATGGSGLIYNWAPGNPTGDGTASVTGLTAGSWTCTVTNDCGASAGVTFTITQPTAPVSGSTITTNVSCFGASTGAIDLTPAGGTPGYTYLWGDLAATNVYSTWDPATISGSLSLASGNLRAMTFSGFNQFVHGTAAVNTGKWYWENTLNGSSSQGGWIGVVNTTTGNTYTFDMQFGQKLFNATGTAYSTSVAPGSVVGVALDLTTGTLTFYKNGVSLGAAFTGLPAGTYKAFIRDGSSFSGVNIDVITNFGQSAFAFAVPSGFNSGLYTSVPTSVTTQDRTGLAAGTYTVVITDANGCTATVAATVTQPAAPVSGTTVVTNVSCFSGSNGSIDLTPNGGTAGYTYNWGSSTAQDRTNLVAGTYTVIITDANGCTGTVTSIVAEPQQISFTAASQTNVSCFGGNTGAFQVNAALGGTGAFTYDWAPGNPTGDGTTSASGLIAGTWTVTATDANGCSAFINFTITEAPQISFTAASQTNVSCFGGSNGAFTVNPAIGGTGSFTYDWTPGNPTGDGTTSVSGLTAGTWTVTATDANGCTAFVNFTITEPQQISFTAAAQTNVSCFGGSNGAFTVNPAIGGAGSFTYDWAPGNPTGDGTTAVTGLTAGTWTVTATDANGCTAFINFTITEPPQISFTAASQTNVSCFGGNTGAFTVNPALGGTGSFTYDWTPGNPTGDGTTAVTGLTAGTWTVTATDANGCSAFINFTITEPPALTVFAMTPPISCNGGTTTVSVMAFGGTSPYTGTGTFTVPAGTYFYPVTDANGCAGGTSTTATEPTALIAASTATPVLCNGGNATVTVTASGGTSPYTGEGTFTVTAGTYSYPVTDANGCTASTSITVAEPAVLTTASSATSVLCNGGNATVTVTASGGTSPYTGEGTFTEAAGTYSYTVTDANGCASSTSITVTEPTALSATSSATTILCNGGTSTVVVAASGGISPYTGDGTFAEFAGYYSYTVTDNNGCASTTSVTISEPTVLSASVNNTVNPTTCGGTDGSIDINATGGTTYYSFLWSNGNPTEDVTGIAAGAYSVTVTDANGCTTTITATLTEPTPPVVTVSLPMDTACGSFPGTISLSGEFPVGGSWSGNTVNGNSFDPFNAGAGLHYITYAYTDTNGCTGTATDSLVVDLCMAIETAATTEWSLYPNPTSGTVTIATNATQNNDVIVEVYTADGKLIFIENKQQTPAITLDLTSEPVGTYFIRLTVNGETTMHRIVKM